MRFISSLILFVALATALTLVANAQNSNENANAARAAEELRTQLFDVQAKEFELQARARQLDEDLKPENIERSLAGIGSTKPEELRELRRRQLTIERDRVRAQLKLVATSRERLESVIHLADTRAYQESAEGGTQSLQMLKGNYAPRPLAIAGMLAAIAILGTALVIAVRRKVVPRNYSRR